MNEFFKILRRFVPPYKKYLILNIIFNILAAILTLFSFAIIIPILEMLFQIKEASYTYMTLADGSFKDVVINNFYYSTPVFKNVMKMSNAANPARAYDAPHSSMTTWV